MLPVLDAGRSFYFFLRIRIGVWSLSAMGAAPQEASANPLRSRHEPEDIT
jgi:hypothetical protein